MPRKFRLLFDKSNKQWFKIYNCNDTGKRKKIYLGAARSKTNDPEAYKRAVRKWEQFKPTIVEQRTRQQKTATSTKRRTYNVNTVAGLIDKYLEDYSKRQVSEGIIAPETFSNRKNVLMKWLDEFVSTKGFKDESQGWGVKKVLQDSRRLQGYHQYLMRISLKEGNISFATARLRMTLVKQFYYWCFHTERIDELPRNINSSYIQMRRPRHLKIESMDKSMHDDVITNEELARFFEYTVQYKGRYPLGLIVLLLLNTGMNLSDVVSITPENLIEDEDGGLSIRKRRRKTGVLGEWRLWSITEEYLRVHLQVIHQIKSLDLVKNPYIGLFPRIDQHTGKPMDWTVELTSNNADEKIRHSNTRLPAEVSLARLFKKSKVNSSIKYFRKTAASSFLKVSEENEVLVQKFLGHRPKTIAMKHYARVSQERLQEFVLAMESELGIDKLHHIIRAEMKRYRRTSNG